MVTRVITPSGGLPDFLSRARKTLSSRQDFQPRQVEGRDMLIMPFDGNGPADVNNLGYLTAWDGAFIVALDRRTDQERWRAKHGLSRQAHVTPMSRAGSNELNDAALTLSLAGIRSPR